MAASSDIALGALVPLKVVVLTESPPREHGAIRTAVARAFQGGTGSADAAEAYFATGEDLGVAVLEAVFAGDGAEAQRIVADARRDTLHTLLVIVLYETPSDAFGKWLAELDQTVERDQTPTHEKPAPPRLALLAITVKERTWSGATQALDYSTPGEYALRPVYAATHALVHAWRALGPENSPLKIFISHAKLDGLPLAQAFKQQLEGFGGTAKFYDAEDIPPGSKWKEILRTGVERSVLVALRTNVYEERFWCVQEMDWAEEYGCPLVLLDARTHLVRTRESLPVGGAPCVHVPDGNLLRALQSGLREALRVRLFARQVDALAERGLIHLEQVLKVPRTSLATVGMRCQARAATTPPVTHVFVPEPFRETHRPVAEKLVQAYFPDAWLGTPKTFIAGLVAGTSV